MVRVSEVRLKDLSKRKVVAGGDDGVCLGLHQVRRGGVRLCSDAKDVLQETHSVRSCHGDSSRATRSSPFPHLLLLRTTVSLTRSPPSFSHILYVVLLRSPSSPLCEAPPFFAAHNITGQLGSREGDKRRAFVSQQQQQLLSPKCYAQKHSRLAKLGHKGFVNTFFILKDTITKSQVMMMMMMRMLPAKWGLVQSRSSSPL